MAKQNEKSPSGGKKIHNAVPSAAVSPGEVEMLMAISDYSNHLSRVAFDDLYLFIVSELRKITGATVALINFYDRLSRDLICRQTTLSEKNHTKLARILGQTAVGFRTPVSEDFYAEMLELRVKHADTLTESTFGSVSSTVNKVIERVFGINYYMGIALVFDKNLIGTMLMAGDREKMICNKELLLPFAAVTANAIELKEAEKLIETSREWGRTIAEDIPALVTRTSPDYIITYANDAYCKFIGKPLHDIVGTQLSAFVPAENQSRVVGQFKELTSEKPIATHEHTNRAYDGSERWIRWTNRALFARDGTLKEILSIGEDITESKKAYYMLKESEELKSSILQASPDLIIRHDLEGRYLDILSGKDDLLYLPRQEMLSKKIEDILPPQLAEKILASIRKAFLSRELERIEFTLETATGSYEFESRIKAKGANEVISFVRDITEQKRFERELRESEEKYREILASIEEGYYEVNLEGKITYCNDATLRMLGYSRDELIGMSYKRFYKDPDTVFKTFHRVFLSGESDRGFTLEILRKDGSSAFGELSVSLIRDKHDRITGFRGLARDITERILFEQKLKYLSLHDQLTGLHNRAYFEEEMARLENSREYPITMISVDLDDLKLINDSMGHDAGDKLLKTAALILKGSVRSCDILARVGGDEFTAILPRADEKAAEIIATRIRNSMDKYNRDNPELPIGLSIGLATAQGAELPLQEVFKRADDHMYHDKLTRNNRARNKTVEALLTALAERDYITEGHTQRLSKLCRQVGEKIDLNSRQLSGLDLLAQVHDLGKVGIPDNILFKESSLTAEEWETMCLHPEKGYRIASTSSDLSGIADFILKHHERWDGNGYPLGLKGEEIPVECRILAIIDAYDAMTNDRPYSKARKSREALQEIKKCAGSQFDPELVDIFLSLC